MAGQSVFFRAFSLLNSGKVIITNRIHHISITPCVGVKQDLEKLKIPEKPKKPLTAYLTYVMERQPVMKKENSSLSPKDVIKRISAEWNSLSSQSKKKYEDQAKENKAVYDSQILDYLANLTPEQEAVLKEVKLEMSEERKRRKLKKEVKSEGKPKRPISSYGLFIRDYFNEVQGKEKNINNLMLSLKGQWAQLSDSDKAKYKLEAEKQLKQYEKDLIDWETRMLKEGKDHLVRVKTLKSHLSKNGTKKKTE